MTDDKRMRFRFDEDAVVEETPERRFVEAMRIILTLNRTALGIAVRAACEAFVAYRHQQAAGHDDYDNCSHCDKVLARILKGVLGDD